MSLTNVESSDDFDEVNRLFSEVDRDFRVAEAKIKKVERLGQGLAFPPVNELRYCAFHYTRAVKSDDEEFIKNEIREAQYHCQRAIHDSIEIEILYYLKKLKKFQNDYDTVPVTDVLDDYLGLLQLAENTKEFIVKRSESSVRENSSYENGEHTHPRENAPYAGADTLLEELQSGDKKLSLARIELNKILKKQQEEVEEKRKGHYQWFIALTIAIASLAVGVIGILINQIWGAPPPPTP